MWKTFGERAAERQEASTVRFRVVPGQISGADVVGQVVLSTKIVAGAVASAVTKDTCLQRRSFVLCVREHTYSPTAGGVQRHDRRALRKRKVIRARGAFQAEWLGHVAKANS